MPKFKETNKCLEFKFITCQCKDEKKNNNL